MGSINWGDAPTWMAGFFAGAAAIYARGMLRSQQRQIAEQRAFIAQQSTNLELERAELRAAAEDRRWAQARRIRVLVSYGGGSTDEEGNVVGYDCWNVDVVNTSEAPIRQVSVRFGNAYNAAFAEEPPSDYDAIGGRRPALVDVLGPARSVVFRSPRLSEAAVDNNPPVVRFTDDSGVNWQTTRFGQLSERTEEAD